MIFQGVNTQDDTVGAGGRMTGVTTLATIAKERTLRDAAGSSIDHCYFHPQRYPDRASDGPEHLNPNSDLNSIRETSERRFHQYLCGCRRVQDLFGGRYP